MTWPKDVGKADLRIEYYRGSGAGGQNKNKRDTACRITHKETKIAACAEEHRTQGKNKKAAFQRLSDQLIPLMREAHRPPRPPIPTNRIRTYHEQAQRVKDVRIKDRVWTYDDVMKGHGLGEIIDEFIRKGNSEA